MNNKSVIVNIDPRWCYWITRGIKTVEVRKTKPDIKTPFKCYVYCSPNNDAYDLLEIHGKSGTIRKGNDKIIGEFVCNKIEEVDVLKFPLCRYVQVGGLVDMKFTEKSCLEINEIDECLDGETGRVWHISDFILYDEPKNLEELGLKEAPQDWQYINR